MKKRTAVLGSIVFVEIVALMACKVDAVFSSGSIVSTVDSVLYETADRETKIQADAVKMSPATDIHPPILLSGEFEDPVPVPGKVNTAGAEDSPFITPDGNTLYFFFSPDAGIPVEKQLYDGVTGIYVSRKIDGEWGEAERVLLQDPGKVALDGCEFVSGDVIWFCSIREGYTAINWFTAEWRGGQWGNWKSAAFNPDFKVGELHFSPDGMELYFGSDRPGGRGKLDLWVSKKAKGEWQEPINLSRFNTPDDEGWPAVSPDGLELWFYRTYSIWRSRKVDGEWQDAEQMVSPLAGEPSVDLEGNLFFVHYYYIDDKMIEADIYVAYRK